MAVGRVSATTVIWKSPAIGWLKNSNWSAELFVNNVLNRMVFYGAQAYFGEPGTNQALVGRPRQFGIGEHDRGNRARRKGDVFSRHHLDGHARLVRRLVREHRLADDVADGEDRRLVRAPLLVDHDEAALIDLNLRALESGNV